jgi:hypothetical protein
MFAKVKAQIIWARQNPKRAVKKSLPYVIPVLVMLFLFVAVSPQLSPRKRPFWKLTPTP